MRSRHSFQLLWGVRDNDLSTSHRETENWNWHVVMTINDHSTQASSSSGEQKTVLDWSVQKCELNQVLQQWHSPKQHRSKRLKTRSNYSRLWSVLPAEGRLSWHFCSCWLCEDHEGDLSRRWTAGARWVNWSSKHKVTAERSGRGQMTRLSCYHRPWFRHGTSTGAHLWIRMSQP